MEVVLLIIHLLICLCLIGLVLLQRSEGGALGMGGGGGGGSLMSGRGAADALAKMTSVAGGFFLVTSLSLTFLSGAAASSDGGSVFDRIMPRQEITVPTLPPAEPDTTRPDPTESSAPEAADTQLASASTGPVEVAPAATDAATRAGPLPASSNATPAPPQRAAVQPASANAGQTATRTPPPAQRSEPAPTPVAARQEAASPPRPLVIPNTSGAISGVNLTDDAASQPESIEIGNGVEAVRRERAGPDQ